MEIEIDKATGRVWVAGKYGISSRLTIADVTAAPFQAKAYALSGLPYKWFGARVGSFGMEFCFAEGVLALVDFHTVSSLESPWEEVEGKEALLNDPDALLRQMDDFSARETAFLKAEKAKADALLEQQLGQEGVRYEYVSPPTSPTDFNVIFSYEWGEVSSLYHFRTRGKFERHGAFVRVEYQGVRLQARRAYVRSGRGISAPGLQALRERLAVQQQE